jgi:hypothetical protein
MRRTAHKNVKGKDILNGKTQGRGGAMPGIDARSIGNKVMLNDNQLKIVKTFVDTHPTFSEVVSYYGRQCTVNGGFVLSVKKEQLPETDPDYKQIREVMEWAIRMLLLYGFVAVRVIKNGTTLQRLFPGKDYTLCMDMSLDSERKWEIYSLHEKNLDNVVLFIQNLFQPSEAGDLRSPGYEAIENTTLVQPEMLDESALKITGLEMAGFASTGAGGNVTPDDIARMEEKLRPLRAYMASIKYLNGIDIRDNSTVADTLDVRPLAMKLTELEANGNEAKPRFLGRVLLMPPYLKTTPVEHRPLFDNHDERIRAIEKRIFLKFGIPENNVFPVSGHISEKTMTLAQNTGNISVEGLQNDLIILGIRLLIILKKDEILPLAGTPDAIEKQWEELDIDGTFLGYNPFLTREVMQSMYDLRVINHEKLQKLFLHWAGLPESYASKEGEFAPRPFSATQQEPGNPNPPNPEKAEPQKEKPKESEEAKEGEDKKRKKGAQEEKKKKQKVTE